MDVDLTVEMSVSTVPEEGPYFFLLVGSAMTIIESIETEMVFKQGN